MTDSFGSLRMSTVSRRLDDKGYRAVPIAGIVRLLACWAESVRTAGVDFDSLGPGLTASAQTFQSSRTARAPQGAAALFVAYLRYHGVLPPPAQSALPEEVWPVLAAFRNRTHLPIVLSAGLFDKPIKVPWWEGRPLRFVD
jgi:hypothetical protein